MHYLNLCPVLQFIGKLALKLFCHWCKATVSTILNNSLLCAYNQRFVLIVYVFGFGFPAGMFALFFFSISYSSNFRYGEIDWTVCEIEYKTKPEVTTKLEISLHFYSISNEIWNLSYVFFFIFDRKECLNVKNVGILIIVEDWFRIIIRSNHVTLTIKIKK